MYVDIVISNIFHLNKRFFLFSFSYRISPLVEGESDGILFIILLLWLAYVAKIGGFTLILDLIGCFTLILDLICGFTLILDLICGFTLIFDLIGGFTLILDLIGCFTLILDLIGCFTLILDLIDGLPQSFI